ncbi:MAG: extracellular solute-binding protein [Atribacterota bacterium]
MKRGLLVLGVSVMVVVIFVWGLAAFGEEKVHVAIQSFAHEALKPFIEQFETQTGIKVILESMPSSGTDALTKLTTYYRAGQSPYDVVSDSDEASPAFARAGWLEPLNDVLPADFFEDFPPSMLESEKAWNWLDEKVYRVRHSFEFGYFFYRKDWFDAMGLLPPATWEEMVDVGKKFTAQGKIGVEDALSKPALLYVYVAYLTLQAGGNPFAFDEGFKTAVKFIHDMIYEHQIFPKEALNKNYDQINEDYMNDRVAMMRQWPYFYSVTRGNAEWYREGKAEIALPPRGPVSSASWAGGWGWEIPKFAPNKEGAKKFIQFILSKEIAPKLARANSWFMNPRYSVMAELGDEGLAKYMKWYSDNNVPAPRPYHPRVAEAQNIVDDVVSAYLIGQMTLDEAVEQGKKMMAELGGQ